MHYTHYTTTLAQKTPVCSRTVIPNVKTEQSVSDFNRRLINETRGVLSSLCHHRHAHKHTHTYGTHNEEDIRSARDTMAMAWHRLVIEKRRHVRGEEEASHQTVISGYRWHRTLSPNVQYSVRVVLGKFPGALWYAANVFTTSSSAEGVAHTV